MSYSFSDFTEASAPAVLSLTLVTEHVCIILDSLQTPCNLTDPPPFFCSCPKTVENFCVHSSNGYYNGHIFHRVIKQFMIQTGDPTGEQGSRAVVYNGYEVMPELVDMLKYHDDVSLELAE